MCKTLLSNTLPALFAAAMLIFGPSFAWAGPQDGASFPLHKAYRSGAAQAAAKPCPMCEEAAKKADGAKSMACPCCAGMTIPAQKSGDGKMSCCDGMKSGSEKGCCK